MSAPHITSGERRGLILLIVLLIAVTVALCWRDWRVDTAGGSIGTDAASDVVMMAGGRDSVGYGGQSGYVPEERKSTRKLRKSRDSISAKRPEQRPVVEPLSRNPRDERVD